MEEEYKRFEFQYGIILLRTKRFQRLMERLGNTRISKPVGWFLLYLLPVAAGLGIFVFLPQILGLFSPSVHQVANNVRSVSPLAYLGLPGINPYLPLVDGWAALIVAMVVHEGAHGVVARSLGYPVKSSGLLFFLFVPIGAFVEVDEDALKAAKARDSGRVLAAGAGVNFVLGLVFLLLLFNVVGTMAPAADGLAVTQVGTSILVNQTEVPTPAALAGLHPGDFILAVNGIHYDAPNQLLGASWYRPGQVINLTVQRAGEQMVISNVTLITNPNNSTLGYLGINDLGYSDLQGRVAGYTGSFLSAPFLYFCLPTLPANFVCTNSVPFSPVLSAFYVSPLGDWAVPLANLLYFFFFLNFNLAIFNALPIYPLDGGQAYRAGLKGLFGSRLSEKGLMRVVTATTLAVIAMIAVFPLSAYLNLI